jgi:hypothetical protein
MLAGMTSCMISPTAAEAVDAFDGLGADALLDFARRRRRGQTDRAYRRLAATILGVDVTALAATPLSLRSMPSDRDIERAA